MAANFTFTRNKTLPDSAAKSDFHGLIDGSDGITATVSGIEISEIDWAGADADIALARASTTTDIVSITGDSLTTGCLLSLASNSSDSSTRNLLEVINNHVDADGAVPIFIQQDGNDYGIDIDWNGTTGSAIRIDSDGNSNASKVVGLLVDIDNAGTEDQIAIDVDQVDESKSYFARFNATTTGWVTTQDPTTNAPAGWVQIMVGSTARLMPYYSKTT